MRRIVPLLLALVAQPAAAEKIAIPFAPPLGRELVYQIDQHRPVAGRDSRFSARRALRFERAADGYSLQAVLRSVDSDASGAAAESFRAALTPLVGVEMRFRLDDDGKIVGLDDIDRVWASIEQGLDRMMAEPATDPPRHRAASAVKALFAGLSAEGRLALLAGEYQPLLLFAGDVVEDDAGGRGVRTVAGSPLGRPVPVEGLLRMRERAGDRLSLQEQLAGKGVQVTMRYTLSAHTGLVEDQTRTLTMGGRTLVETRTLRATP